MNWCAIYLLIMAFGVGWYLATTDYYLIFKFRIVHSSIVTIALFLTIFAPTKEWPLIVVTSIYFLFRLLQEIALGYLTIVKKKDVKNDKEV